MGLLASGALAANIQVPVLPGGMLSFVLNEPKLDPASVFSYQVATVTNMCGCSILSFYGAVLVKLGRI